MPDISLIIAVPLLGAAVLALLPDRAPIQKAGALIVTLADRTKNGYNPGYD